MAASVVSSVANPVAAPVVSSVVNAVVNPGDSEHPHRQIAASLRQRISSGEWGAGQRLPSIPAIAAEYGVAKQTVQRSIDQLRIEGVLITRPGSGTFVRGTRRRLSRLSRARYGRRRGYHTDLPGGYRQELISVGLEPAPAEVATAFGMPEASVLLVRRHIVRTDDQAPAELGASWFDPAGTAETTLAQPRAAGRPLYQEVEDQTGRHYSRAVDQLSARLPTRDEAELLHIRPDTPVLNLLHTAYDAGGRPIEVAQATWPGPMTVLTDEYPIPGPDHA
jgi:GntR family transcriptional regulator